MPIKLDGVSDYGMSFAATDERIAVPFLKRSAETMLPPGTRYEVRRLPSDKFAWYYAPRFDGLPEWKMDEQMKPARTGYVVLGRFVTPVAKQAAAA